MAQTKEIQRRIKSINNTKKITKAMEMVAAAKMRKAIEAVLKTRQYANLSWLTVLNISKSIGSGKDLHPLLSKREDSKKICVILISSNRGLCGGFNTAVINKVHNSIQKHSPRRQDGKKADRYITEFVIIGKKGNLINSRYKYNVIADFPKLDIVSEVKEVRPVAKLVIDDFLAEKYDKIMVAYTDYVSASKQVPRVKQILPVDIEAENDHLGVVGADTRVGLDKEFIEKKYNKENQKSFQFIYEPNAQVVLDNIIPRLIEVQLFQALLESNASEHSARMQAMHQASESAGELVEELTLFYNKARQAGITAEIAEISAGANSLG